MALLEALVAVLPHEEGGGDAEGAQDAEEHDALDQVEVHLQPSI